jgi:hypothetical protein
LEDFLGRQRATATYIVSDWDCLSFNKEEMLWFHSFTGISYAHLCGR